LNKVLIIMLLVNSMHAFSLECTIESIWVEIENHDHLIGKKFTAVTGNKKLILNGAVNDIMYYNHEDTLHLRRYVKNKIFSYSSKKYHSRASISQLNRYMYEYEEDEGIKAVCYRK